MGAMIYMDVTSSCKSSVNTGVQRVVRGLYGVLKRCSEVVPLVWHPKLKSYCRLTRQQRCFLEEPHGKVARDGLEGVFARNKSLQFTLNRFRKLDLPGVLRDEDIFLAAEIFQDNRIEVFDEWLGRGMRGGSVAVFYDALNWTHPELSAHGRSARFEEYMEALARFDGVSSISDTSGSDLKRFWETIGQMGGEVLSMLLPVEFGESRVQGTRPGSVSILSVGTLEPRKNHMKLLAASEQLWEEGLRFELNLVGRETGGVGKEIADKVRELQKKWPLRWEETVDEEALVDLYQAATFTVYPSLVEGFGLPILESLWFGCPCICQRKGAIAEVAEGGGCVMVDTEDESVLCAAMRDLIEEKGVFEQLAKAAEERSFKSWDAYGQEFMAFLGEIGSRG